MVNSKHQRLYLVSIPLATGDLCPVRSFLSPWHTKQRRSRHVFFKNSEGSSLAAQVGQQFTQPGLCGPGIDPTKIVLRPEGPVVRFDEAQDHRNSRPFRPQILLSHRFPGPQGPGWVNCWPFGPPEEHLVGIDAKSAHIAFAVSPSQLRIRRPAMIIFRCRLRQDDRQSRGDL